MPGPGYARHLLRMPLRDQRPVRKLEQRLARLCDTPVEAVLPTASGRAAIYAFLSALDLPAGSEVMMQAFTCVTAAAPVLQAGLRPVWADIDPATLSISIESLRQRLTPATRVIILQHTFGIPGPLDEVVAIARERGIHVLEDCAHALGTRPTASAGARADASILSFGVGKMLWTKSGGALVVHNPALRAATRQRWQRLPVMTTMSTLRWLLYPVVVRLLRSAPSRAQGAARRLLDGVGLLADPMSRAEIEGRPGIAPARISPAVAATVLDAMRDLDENLTHRGQVTRTLAAAVGGSPWIVPLQTHDLPLLHVPLVCADTRLRDGLRGQLQREGVAPNTWYDPPLFPQGTNGSAYNYDATACPTATDIALRILNLPNGRHVSIARASELGRALVDQAAALQS